MSGQAPLIEIEEGVARITLRRPRQANRLAAEDLGTLRGFIDAVNANAAVRVLVLAGEGKHFCSGFDLGALGAIDAGARFGELADALEAARPITIARLHGGVYGGAADLALACDFRFGTPAVEMFVPAARIGLHFYAGGLQRFVNRLGLATAKQVLLGGRTLDAPALLGCGYLDQLLPDVDSLDKALAALTAQLLDMAPLALLPMKQHLNAIAAGRLDAERLAADILRARDSADLAEGQAAWAGKRPAKFKGC
ncbi:MULTISPECIES: enoyl-CoA hydratase/isomerase family protein [Roseateles]|uniref:Enoyl-CoA hydratase/carnithine racemase n=1 Tax=Pelomonas aquatica TaxID=431058 RepID=A0ABU1ZGF4_9BURK|nr:MULTISPECIES: enoyl-CoA hydratase/isomerase family protein [Roseateles]KQY85312.1 3-hydroxybutyryl-CoA dehydratase [Pelomonas sp. Root1444]MDR7299543.1 enoyl-CoA hydratase/carnithine racemase [Pelomonas aquatica]